NNFNEFAAFDSPMKLRRNCFVCGQSHISPQRIGHHFPHISDCLALSRIVTSEGDGFLCPFCDLVPRETHTAALDSFSHRTFGLVVVASIHFQRSLSHLCMVISLAESIRSRSCLIESGTFLHNCTFLLKTLFHLLILFAYFFSTRTSLLQILLAEAFDLRRSGALINFNLITERLQFFC